MQWKADEMLIRDWSSDVCSSDLAVVTVARVHSGVVWVLLAAVVIVLLKVRRGDADPATAGRGGVLLAVIVAQGGLGYLQYATGVTEILVGGHVLGSVIVWVAALRFHLAITRPLPVPVTHPRTPPPAPARLPGSPGAPAW